MVNPKVRKTVVVQRHSARQPAVGDVAAAKLLKLSGRTYTFNRRVEPKSHQNRRIGRGTTSLSLPRTYRLVQGRKIKARNKAPHNPRPMVSRQQTLKIQHVPLKLRPIGANKSRLTRHGIILPTGEIES